MGSEKKERKREGFARRRVNANSLAVGNATVSQKLVVLLGSGCRGTLSLRDAVVEPRNREGPRMARFLSDKAIRHSWRCSAMARRRLGSSEENDDELGAGRVGGWGGWGFCLEIAFFAVPPDFRYAMTAGDVDCCQSNTTQNLKELHTKQKDLCKRREPPRSAQLQCRHPREHLIKKCSNKCRQLLSLRARGPSYHNMVYCIGKPTWPAPTCDTSRRQSSGPLPSG
ncbi:uncharacterized protein EI97DRAFT_248242 [Westerdykella ornata]|uniref:Uncharacterized protein n=1 Tax=Westerdykella ornata TaxID=318751 RepID=A0A6A6JP83_WESOR|nr:uncharacterized protein EI97DRAFT_248242 [Westerdykella ornata]KAF2278207.1 hypothetical protein EI97DRAFT_248242 [Westerdykella ornata]